MRNAIFLFVGGIAALILRYCIVNPDLSIRQLLIDLLTGKILF
jgi:hypothetical protein